MSRCVVVGSGAREHALAWVLAECVEVIVTPGNAGMAAHGLACVATSPLELDGDLFVIGPEEPLVNGVADALRAQGKLVFGPGAEGARLEGSKAYLKEFLEAAGVPSAAYGVFSDLDEALAYLETMRAPYVIKTDGLAAGKGVLVTSDLVEARADVRAKLCGDAFGAAGSTIVIEEGLDGEECSLLVLVDGKRATPLALAQDFKRVGDGDEGPNTGGMGAYAPVELDDANRAQIDHAILAPTLGELRRRGVDYRGVLYAGIMLTADGPKLLEYNVRFGDPEAEVVVPLYRGAGANFYDVLSRVASGATREGDAAAFRGAAVTVVLAAAGYPLAPRSGDVIDGLGEDGQLATPMEGVVVFHAGTARDASGRFVTRGGRVLAVTGFADDVCEARERAYAGADLVTFEGCVRRRDVAARAARGG